jgi:phosphoadenosine phosphosulfate reductase
MKDKIEHAKKLIKDVVDEYGNHAALGCSWGKDSMVLLHLALDVNPDIQIFSILTIHKPKKTFKFVVDRSRDSILSRRYTWWRMMFHIF